MKTGYAYFNKVNILASLVMLGVLLLGGCAATGTSGPDSAGAAAEATQGRNQAAQAAGVNTAASIDAPLVSANDSLLAMLRYSRFISGLSTEQLTEEFKRINDAYFIRPNDRSGLKRAMLLMKPGTDFHDLNQAKQVVTDIVNGSDAAVPAFKEYAEFMLAIIDSQVAEHQRYSQLEEQLRQEVNARKQAEEKLEALKSIEESMIQRRSQ
ncbi:MAG: hypothetical protein L0Z73_13135 [Gammaproteobacteria bacterium]|nr:hypothetical protein [Gammaproteobacteria bacterium]